VEKKKQGAGICELNRTGGKKEWITVGQLRDENRENVGSWRLRVEGFQRASHLAAHLAGTRMEVMKSPIQRRMLSAVRRVRPVHTCIQRHMGVELTHRAVHAIAASMQPGSEPSPPTSHTLCSLSCEEE
jgi:hypothetical protein